MGGCRGRVHCLRGGSNWLIYCPASPRPAWPSLQSDQNRVIAGLSSIIPRLRVRWLISAPMFWNENIMLGAFPSPRRVIYGDIMVSLIAYGLVACLLVSFIVIERYSKRRDSEDLGAIDPKASGTSGFDPGTIGGKIIDPPDLPCGYRTRVAQSFHRNGPAPGQGARGSYQRNLSNC